MGAFCSALGEEHPVIRNDANRVAVEMCKAAKESRAVACLELVKSATVYDAGNNLFHIVLALKVDRYYAI